MHVPTYISLHAVLTLRQNALSPASGGVSTHTREAPEKSCVNPFGQVEAWTGPVPVV